MVRIASATGVPGATSTSTWRSLATISSGLCLFLRIVILLRLVSHTSGWTTPLGADHSWKWRAGSAGKRSCRSAPFAPLELLIERHNDRGAVGGVLLGF